MNHPEGLLQEVAQTWSLSVPPKVTEEQLTLLLAERINTLINEDFEQLIRSLYRIDVDERKLKELLRDYPEQDAGLLIAKLILDRQKQKIIFRKTFSGKSSEQDGEEKW